MHNPDDPRLVFWCGADETGSLDLNDTLISPLFAVVTLCVQNAVLQDALRQYGEELADGAGVSPDPFHATRDPNDVRRKVFSLLSGYPLRIDVTYAQKADIPVDLRGDAFAFYSNMWFLHLRRVLPAALGANNKVRLVIANLEPHSKREAFKRAIAEVTGGAVVPSWFRPSTQDGAPVLLPKPVFEMPAVMWSFENANDNPLLQLTDYCAWALQRWLVAKEDTWYRQLGRFVRSLNLVSFSPVPDDHSPETVKNLSPAPKELARAQEHFARAEYDAALASLSTFVGQTDDVEALREAFPLAGDIIDSVRAQSETAVAASLTLERLCRKVDSREPLNQTLLLFALYSQGRHLHRLGRVDEAINAYKKMQQVDAPPDVPLARAEMAKGQVNLGNCLVDRGDLQAARDAYERVLGEYDPNQSPLFVEPATKAMLSLARLDNRTGDPANALDRTQRLLDRVAQAQDPVIVRDVSFALLERAQAAMALGLTEEARAAWTALVARSENAETRPPEDVLQRARAHLVLLSEATTND